MLILNNDFEIVHEVSFPRSIGYTYANFTDNLPGMHLNANEDEYVVMGFSCYGEPTHWEQFYEMFQCVPSYTMEDQDGWDQFEWEQKFAVKKLHIFKMIDYLIRKLQVSRRCISIPTEGSRRTHIRLHGRGEKIR